MTQPSATRTGCLASSPTSSPRSPCRITKALGDARRRIIVAVVLVIGAVLLGFSLRRQPGARRFYWLTFALAAVWAMGAFASGPLHLGVCDSRGRNQRPVITGSVVGLAARRGLRGRRSGSPRNSRGARLCHPRSRIRQLRAPCAGRCDHGDQWDRRGTLLSRRAVHRAGEAPPGNRVHAHVHRRDLGRHPQPDAGLRGASSSARCARTSAAPPGECSHRCSPTSSGAWSWCSHCHRYSASSAAGAPARPCASAPPASRPPPAVPARCRPPGKSSASTRLSTAGRRSRTTPA